MKAVIIVILLSVLLTILIATPCFAQLQRLPGDAKHDGAISVSDAMFIDQYLEGLREGTTDPDDLTRCFLPDACWPARELYPDVYPSIEPEFSVSPSDAQYIRERLAGLRDEYYHWIGG